MAFVICEIESMVYDWKTKEWINNIGSNRHKISLQTKKKVTRCVVQVEEYQLFSISELLTSNREICQSIREENSKLQECASNEETNGEQDKKNPENQ